MNSEMSDVMANCNLNIKEIPEDPELRFQSELLVPTSRPDPFACFSPNAIKSSLKSNYSPSLRPRKDFEEYPRHTPYNQNHDTEIDQLIQENDRLIHENLHQANLIDSISHGHGNRPDIKNEEAMVLIHENDSLHAEIRSQAKLIQSLSDKLHLATRNSNLANEELEGTTDQIVEMQDRLNEYEYKLREAEGRVRKAVDEVDEKDGELERVGGTAKKMELTIEALTAKNNELLNVVADFTARYQDVVREATVAAQREKKLTADLEQKDLRIDELILGMEQERETFKSVQDQAEIDFVTIKNLQKKIAQADRKELEYIEINQKQMQDVEESNYERDVCLKREKLLAREIETLTKKYQDQSKTFRDRLDNEISMLRSQFSLEKRKFVEESAKLEQTCTLLQSQIERALRDKRAAESELEKATRHIPQEADRLTMAVEEAHSKLRASERDRHDAIQKLESIHQKMLRDQNQFELEKHNASERYEELYKRLRRAEREVEDSKKEMIQLQEKISVLEHEKKSGLEQIRNLTSSHESKCKSINSKHESLIQELNCKLESATEAELSLSRDMQRLLSNQRIMSEKWKDESEQIKSHYEHLNMKLKDQIIQFQERVQELEKIIQSNSSTRKDLINQVTHEKKQYRQLHHNYLILKSQKDGLARQISACLQKENDLIEERKKISNDLQKALLEKEHRRRDDMKASVRPRLRQLIKDSENTFNPSLTCKLEADIERVQSRNHKKLLKTLDTDSE